eukprot:TRINITY_DN14506_c0_g1_i1.p1 TRINITY_DN14506_c0_g1~~TRINITY_DN14506_c0_g1_i1.p1  ORF type:complete len:880 (-),score=197.62 TRINITY_DN14506_c0_g1_i1:108-2723(-)
MEQPDGSWQEVEAERKIKRDRKSKSKRFFLWKVSSIVPCRTNRFRLMSGENYIEAELAPADLEDMEDLEFSPGQPQNIIYANDELKWDTLECATSYQVDILKIDDGEGEDVRSEVINENSIYLPELEYCKEFEYIIFPYVGEFESQDDEAIGEFTREPNHDVLSALEMTAEASEDTVSVSWEVSNDVRCIDKYEVEVCEADDTTMCHAKTVYDPDEELLFKVDIDGLKQATEYRITLAAVYRGNVYYKDIKKQFNTKLDLEGFKVEALADFDSVTITWSDVAIAQSYIVYRQYGAEDWVRLAQVADDVTFQSEEEPCIDIAYAVAVVTSDMNYDKKESNTVNLKLDESLPFLPTEQSVVMDVDGATLSWTHLACIDAYEVFICDEQMMECSSNITLASEIIDDDGLFLDIEDLTPCTTYNVEIVPHIGDHGWLGDPLALEITTEQYLEPPSQDSVYVEAWSPHSPVRISWENTSCAESYEIFFEDTMAEESYFYFYPESENIEFDSPERNSCTEYEFQIVAVAGENRSEDSTTGHFFVGPTKLSLEQFKPNIEMVDISSVNMTIPNSRALKCIDEFSITICTPDGNCPVNEVIDMNADDEENFPFNAEGLTSATDYTVSIYMVYEGETLHTFTDDISTPMDLYGVNLTASLEGDLVYLEWQEVYGADEYEIGQQYGAADTPPEVMVTTTGVMETTQAMCSTATYTLTVKHQGQADKTVIYSDEVTTYLNDTEPFMASNLNIDHEENNTTLTWDHLGSCIDHYVIILNDKAVVEHPMTEGDSHVSVSLDNVENCKEYKLKIVPVFTSGEKWEAEPEIQQEFKRLDDKKCVIPKVTRQAVKALKRGSGSSSLSSSLVSLFLISVIVRYLGAQL